MRKRILLILLGAIIGLPLLARDFTYTYEGQTITYTVLDEDAKTCKTKEGVDPWDPLSEPENPVEGKLILPSYPRDGEAEFTLAEIGQWSFGKNRNLTSVVIPNTVEIIGAEAFMLDESLVSVDFGNSVKEIGWNSFKDCTSLMNIIIPESVKTIVNGAFCGCENLTSIVIGNSVESIGDMAFKMCYKLTSVVIPSSVTSIGYYTFDSCHAIKKFAYPINLGYLNIPGKAFPYFSGNSVVENGWVYGLNKSHIFFAPADLKGDYEIPSSVNNINDGAFWGCSELTSIEIHSSLLRIGAEAFYGCPNLNTIILEGTTDEPRTPTLIENAFTPETYESALLNIEKGEDIEHEGQINNIELINYFERGWDKFYHISFDGEPTRLYSDGILQYRLIENHGNGEAYVVNGDYDDLLRVDIPGSVTDGSSYRVTAIAPYAFKDLDRITELSFKNPSNLARIGAWAFQNCLSLERVVLPETVLKISYNAFENNLSLTEIKLNEGIELIGNCTFRNCQSLSSIEIPSTVILIGMDAFGNTPITKVMTESLENWLGINFLDEKANPLWNGGDFLINGEKIKGTLKIPDTVTRIYNNAFYGYNYTKAVIIPKNVQEIGLQAFSDFREITIEDGTTPIVIGYAAFNESAQLYLGRPLSKYSTPINVSYLTIGNTVENIPAYAFAGNYHLNGPSRLTSLSLGTNIKLIGEKAFQECTTLREVVLPPFVETIGASAFEGATNLTSIIMGHSVKSIGDRAFYNCPANTVAITAVEPPAATVNTFNSYSGRLWVPGENAVTVYSNAPVCWDRFDGYVMVTPSKFDTEGDVEYTGKAGDTFQLTATLMPENVTLPQVFWRTTNPDIAIVDENGVVTLQKDMSEILTRAAENTCQIIASSLYADGPELVFNITNTSASVDSVFVENGEEGGIDFTAPYYIYNLNGVLLGNTKENVMPGLYIIRQGSKAKKIIKK